MLWAMLFQKRSIVIVLLYRQGMKQSFFGVLVETSYFIADCILDQQTVKWIFFFDLDSGFSDYFETDRLAALFLQVLLKASWCLLGDGEGISSENMLVLCLNVGGECSLMAQNCEMKLLFLPQCVEMLRFLLQRGNLRGGDCLLGEVRSLLSSLGGLTLTSVFICLFSLILLQGVSLTQLPFPLSIADRYKHESFSVCSSLIAVLCANNRRLQSCRSASSRIRSPSALIKLFSLSINQPPQQYTSPGLIKQLPPLKFISMNRVHIEDLSAIAERKSYEESQRTFDESKPQPNVRCPQNNRENYQCPICTRLRAICPYTKLTHCLHDNKERIYKSDYFMEKSNLSTLAGDRQRTLSNHDALKYEQSRREVIRVNELRPPVTQTQVVVSPAEEIIYYPVIHNHYVISPNLEKSKQNTPIRVKHSRRIDYSDDVILTPTQIKEMLYSNKE